MDTITREPPRANGAAPAENPFRAFAAKGFTRLVPVTPPGATPSANSSLARRSESIGKAPGVRKPNGEWIGVDLRTVDPTPVSLDAWAAMGASVGIRTGGGLVALDIDVLDADIVYDIIQDATIMLGDAPVRYGRRPKALLLYRAAEEIPYRRIKFRHGSNDGLVELLSEGRQFVAHGIHSGTGQPYEWAPGIPPLDTLATVTAEQVARLFARLAEDWKATDVVEDRLEGRANVDQRQLLGDPETVKRAVAALPNTSSLFPTYDDYVRVGYAIKGATRDDDEGLALFQEWAAKWADGTNDPDRVAADWQRMKPPYSVGAQYLYSLAEKHGGGRFQAAEAWFTGTELSQAPSKSPWDEAPAEKEIRLPLAWMDPATWDEVTPPPREWEVEGWIPRHEVTLLYGDGGIGKTLAIHQYAICAAAGIEWLGQKTRKARVMVVLCEDNVFELQRRHKSILKALGLKSSDVGDRLRIISRAGEENILGSFDRATGSMRRTPFWHQVREDAVAWQADVVIVDTIADTFGGSEIDRGQVNGFMKSVLGGLARAVGGSVVALGHPSVAGRAEGRSGSTAWSNAARSRIYLRYPKGAQKGDVRELEGMKSNYGPAGSMIKIRWQRGAFVALAATKQGVSPEEVRASPALPSIGTHNEQAVIVALAQAEKDAVSLSPKKRSPAYAPRQLMRLYPSRLGGMSLDEIDQAILSLLGSGAIREVEFRDTHRNMVPGYTIAPERFAPGPALSSGTDNLSSPGVFQ